MSITLTIANGLAFAVGKFLLKKYLNDDGVDSVAEALTDIGKSRLQNSIDQRAAARAAEGWADKIVADLSNLLDEDQKESPDLDIEAVAKELLETLAADIAPVFFLAGDLEAKRVATEFRERRPLPKGRLNLTSDLAYEKSLDHAVHSLTSIVASLPRFQERAIAESLKRLRFLDDTVDKILESNRRIEREVKRISNDGDDGRFEVEYRQAVAANLDYIELFGITIPPELKRFQLTDGAFVSLNLQRSKTRSSKPELSKKAIPKAVQDEESDSESMSYASTFDQLQPGDGRLLIRGAAGSGKTTLLRKVAIEAAGLTSTIVRTIVSGVYVTTEYNFLVDQFKIQDENFRQQLIADAEPVRFDKTHTWREKVPFVVLLRHCRDGKLPLAEDFPRLIGEGIGTPPTDWVRTILKDGRGLVLIDGVDEVPPNRRGEVVRWIEQLTIHYPKSYFIVTTRPEAVPVNWLTQLGFREALINPMGNSDVDDFIRRWHDIAQKNLSAAGKPTDLSDKRQRLLEQLDENPVLRPLSTYPLLCGSICVLHLDRSGTLPESQSALCDAMCDSLLHHREREQDGLDLQPFPAAYRELSVEQKRTLIQDLAVYMVEEGRSALTHDEAQVRLAKKLSGFKNRKEGEAKEVLRGLLERSGVLREPVPNEVDFLHNTFKEYLAGEYFAAEKSTHKLIEHVFAANEGAESWRRVTLFAAGSRRAPAAFAIELIRRLLDDSASVATTPKGKRKSRKAVLSDPLRQRHLLALQCQIVADGQGLSPELKISWRVW